MYRNLFRLYLLKRKKQRRRKVNPLWNSRNPHCCWLLLPLCLHSVFRQPLRCSCTKSRVLRHSVRGQCFVWIYGGSMPRCMPSWLEVKHSQTCSIRGTVHSGIITGHRVPITATVFSCCRCV